MPGNAVRVGALIRMPHGRWHCVTARSGYVLLDQLSVVWRGRHGGLPGNRDVRALRGEVLSAAARSLFAVRVWISGGGQGGVGQRQVCCCAAVGLEHKGTGSSATLQRPRP